ncbi:helix-turn-helix transcriptional regulator [Lapidilactobacillus luobeiensis]|uniref:helix-turn-helix transcriptional regulator n=1 Tax=Lapidilactobacillus luobeiensis TaxID=2950371 RepID=UPI0021C37A52|nr:helix-turn-helix transcriptional regulator [Lapidilactobacillus luobeiensis]
MKNAVRRIRRERNITQETLAKDSGISRQYLSKIESSSVMPSTEISLSLAKSLGLKVEDLFFYQKCKV